MNLSKLLGVLVVGGSLLVAGGCDGEADRDEQEERERPVVGGPDAASAVADATPDQGGDGGNLLDCFCNQEPCCERDEQGNGTLQEGFECCWATTC
jgi:hypothetical protein